MKSKFRNIIALFLLIMGVVAGLSPILIGVSINTSVSRAESADEALSKTAVNKTVSAKDRAKARQDINNMTISTKKDLKRYINLALIEAGSSKKITDTHLSKITNKLDNIAHKRVKTSIKHKDSIDAVNLINKVVKKYLGVSISASGDIDKISGYLNGERQREINRRKSKSKSTTISKTVSASGMAKAKADMNSINISSKSNLKKYLNAAIKSKGYNIALTDSEIEKINGYMTSLVAGRVSKGKSVTSGDISAVVAQIKKLVKKYTGVDIDIDSGKIRSYVSFLESNAKALTANSNTNKGTSSIPKNSSGTSSIPKNSSTSKADSEDSSNPKISIVSPPKKDANKSNKGTIFSLCNKINNSLWKDGIFVDRSYQGGSLKDVCTEFLSCSFDESSNICTITVNMIRYNKLANSEQQKIMQRALDAIYESDVSRINRNKIYNELCALDTTTSSLVRQLSDDVHADFYTAYSYFKPFSGPIGTLLGILTIAIFAFLGLTIVIDIAYITIPFVQELLGRLSKGEKIKCVSLEAANAVKEAESKSGQEYINPLGVYLKSKTRQYIAIAICILYLVSGNLFSFLASFIDYFTGIFS